VGGPHTKWSDFESLLLLPGDRYGGNNLDPLFYYPFSATDHPMLQIFLVLCWEEAL